jgi:chromate transporter
MTQAAPPAPQKLAVPVYPLGQVTLYFLRLGTVGFGGPVALVGYMHRDLVERRGWIAEEDYKEGLALAQLAPGPVVITTGFIGFLVAGSAGAVVAALATFLPCYLITVLAAPYFKKYGQRPGIAAFVSGVTSATIGAITGAVIILGHRSITGMMTALLAVTTAAILWRSTKVLEPLLVLGAALLGLVACPLVGR